MNESTNRANSKAVGELTRSDVHRAMTDDGQIERELSTRIAAETAFSHE